MAESISDILEKEDVNWKTVEAAKSSYKKIADGKYATMITDAKLTTSKANNAMLVLELTVQGEKFKGYKINSYNLLSGDALGYTKQKLELLEIECKKLTDLVPLVQSGEFVGLFVEVNTRTTNGSTTVFFNRKIDETDVLINEATAPNTEDDDVPW